MDYQIQQDKVLTKIADEFALMLGAYSIRDLCRAVYLEAKEKGKFDRLNETHSLASGLKAVLTNDCLHGMEVLRRAMGGHGFSMYSGLPGLIGEQSPTPTYEGNYECYCRLKYNFTSSDCQISLKVLKVHCEGQRITSNCGILA